MAPVSYRRFGLPKGSTQIKNYSYRIFDITRKFFGNIKSHFSVAFECERWRIERCVGGYVFVAKNFPLASLANFLIFRTFCRKTALWGKGNACTWNYMRALVNGDMRFMN